MFSSIPKLVAGGCREKNAKCVAHRWHGAPALCLTSHANLLSHQHPPCHLPSCHHFLATLFSKIILQGKSGPTSWYTSNIKLIHKAGNPSLTSNFRPIAFTSCRRKLFHKIIAKCLGRFLVSNHIIDTLTQKGFLSELYGAMEHTFALNSLNNFYHIS